MQRVCDLMYEEGWCAACRGCELVYHVASPFTMKNNVNDVERVLKPALLGSMHVMFGAAMSQSVKRVVITSSVAAVNATWSKEMDQMSFGETDWTDVWSPSCFVYPRSKTVSELCAWLFATKSPISREEILRLMTLPNARTNDTMGDIWLASTFASIEKRIDALGVSARLDVVAVLPSIVVGEVLLPKHSGHVGSTADFVYRSMVQPDSYGQLPYELGMVGVTDIARLHVLAGSELHLSGRRIVANAAFISSCELSRIVKQYFGPAYGPRFVFTWPRSLMILWFLTHPYCLQMISIAPDLTVVEKLFDRYEKRFQYDARLASSLLNNGFRSLETTIVAAGNSFITLGLVSPIRGTLSSSLSTIIGILVACASCVIWFAASRT